jgi:hypothetical protein
MVYALGQGGANSRNECRSTFVYILVVSGFLCLSTSPISDKDDFRRSISVASA